MRQRCAGANYRWSKNLSGYYSIHIQSHYVLFVEKDLMAQ